MPHRFFYPVLAAACALFLCAGCLSRTTPPYRRIDTETPEFKAAIARETAVETAKGTSSKKAAEIALRRVTNQAIEAEKERRTDMVAPLTTALAALDQPRGCWAHTVATTITKDGKTTLDVERFDPSQPDARLWTLVSRNGLGPTESEQADYRKDRLKKWKKQQSRAANHKPDPERVNRQALYANLKIERPTDNGPVSFSFDREGRSGLGIKIPPLHETYLIDEAASRVVHTDKAFQGTSSALGGTAKILAFDASTDYVVVDPAVAPFPSKNKVHYRIVFFGSDTGDVTIESAYSDYRRVKCYEDRFEVQIGAPTLQDFLPEK